MSGAAVWGWGHFASILESGIPANFLGSKGCAEPIAAAHSQIRSPAGAGCPGNRAWEIPGFKRS